MPIGLIRFLPDKNVIYLTEIAVQVGFDESVNIASPNYSIAVHK